MSKEEIEPLKIYANPECTEPLTEILWINTDIIPVVEKDGSIRMANFVKVGERATAECWVKNGSKFDFGIQAVMCSNPNIQVFLTESVIYPTRPVKLSLLATAKEGESFGCPSILIKGYYVKKVTE